WSEEELRDRVFTIQDRTYEMRNIAIDAVLQLSRQIAREAAADSADSAASRIQLARDYQRWAQFYADFVEAENSMGFHADQEAVRILGKSVNYSRLGQMALSGEAVPPPSATVAATGPAEAPPQTVTPEPE